MLMSQQELDSVLMPIFYSYFAERERRHRAERKRKYGHMMEVGW